jgi:hypothetical protein
MKLTFTVETGQVDGNGDIINLDGVTMPDKVMVVEEFDCTRPIGTAEVKRQGDELKATMEVPDRLLDKYPAIGFSVGKLHIEGKCKVFDETVLQWIGLCTKENTNPSIKTIREQTKDK